MSTDNLEVLQLGDYQIRGLLGSGGMARVYRGYDPALDREVAIKVIRTADQPPDFIARFRREARVVANLRHPNIVQVYQFGEQDDFVYMVQELLPGPTLAQRIRRAGKRYISLSNVHAMMTQLASALDFAHEQGVMHRDVKPANALYNTLGELVLTDFGLARNTADTSHTATGAGVVLGTPGYISPEQAISSATLTPACDIYALGVVLFELLTSRLPFQADAPMEVVLKHLYETPPLPSSLRPDVPPAVDKVILRALNKEPEKRYNSAGALVSAFQAAWPERATPEPDPSSESDADSAPRSTKGKSSSVSRSRTKKPEAQESVIPPKEQKVRTGDTPSGGIVKPASGKQAEKEKTRAGRAGGEQRADPPLDSAEEQPSQETAPAPARKSIRLRIALLTVCLVGILILVGLELNEHTVTYALQHFQVFELVRQVQAMLAR